MFETIEDIKKLTFTSISFPYQQYSISWVIIAKKYINTLINWALKLSNWKLGKKVSKIIFIFFNCLHVPNEIQCYKWQRRWLRIELKLCKKIHFLNLKPIWNIQIIIKWYYKIRKKELFIDFLKKFSKIWTTPYRIIKHFIESRNLLFCFRNMFAVLPGMVRK